jgi:hypothetical protein
MQKFLKVIFAMILIAMLAITTIASMDRGVFQAVDELWPDLWFKATLMDAYFGFLTFYIWVAYKQRRWVAKVVWFLLIMAFGNLAMAAYVLIQLYRMAPDESFETLLTKRI